MRLYFCAYLSCINIDSAQWAVNAFQFDVSYYKTAIYTFIAQASPTPVKLLRKTKRDFNFPYIYHKGVRRGGGTIWTTWRGFDAKCFHIAG